MSIDFTGVKAVTVPEGTVKKITRKSDGVVLWEKPLEQIVAPMVISSLTYTGSVQYPTVIGYDSNTMISGGDTSATNAGTYTVTYKPKDGYCWIDGTIETKYYTWSIAKAAGSLSISSTSITLDSSNTSQTITVTRAGDGEISAVSSDTSVVTVSVSGNVVTVNSVNNTSGSAIITVSVAEGTNWQAATDVTCSVSAEFVVYTTMRFEVLGDEDMSRYTVFKIDGVDYSEYLKNYTETTINVLLGATASFYLPSSKWEYGFFCDVEIGTPQSYYADGGEGISCTFIISEAVFVQGYLDIYGGSIWFHPDDSV